MTREDPMTEIPALPIALLASTIKATRAIMFSCVVSLSAACGSQEPTDSSATSSSQSSSSSIHSVTIDEESTALCRYDGVIEATNAGFAKSGYINTDNAVNTQVVSHIRADQELAEITIRFSNGTNTSRPADIFINGQPAATLSFVPTSEWTQWTSITAPIDLQVGSNTIAIVATTEAGLPNIDQWQIMGESIGPGNCAVAAINSEKYQYHLDEHITLNAAAFERGQDSITSFEWQFGDGHSATGASVTHQFTQPGTFTVSLTTTDINGLQSQSSQVLHIVDSLPPVTVFIAGDSTVSNYTDTSSPNDQAGWGQKLPLHFTDLAKIENHAIGGRTARRFIDEGRLQAIWDKIQPGDYLLVQFGTNDGHRTATYTINGNTIPYYLDPATDFKAYLRQYIEGAQSRQAHLVLVTPPPRNSAYCTGGNGTGAHAQAMRELAAETGASLVDLNQKTVTYLTNICPAPIPEDFFFVRQDGSVDGTHFQENGAFIMSQMIASGLLEVQSPLGLYLKSI